MKPAQRYGIVAGLALLGTGTLVAALLGRTEVPADEVEQQLEAVLRELAAHKEVKHAILAVESGDGSFRWIGAAGQATPDGTPMRAETPFFIASVTKLYIAAAVLKLHERGELDIEEPIAAYLPQTLIRRLHRRRGREYTSSITIRHLLAHTSGLPDYLEERPRGGRSLSERLVQEGDVEFTTADVLSIVRDELTPHFPPQPSGVRRQKARYSDANYQLLIALLEAVTGKRLHDALEELLFRPLDLRHSYVAGHAPAGLAPRQAALWADGQPLELPLALQSTGDLFSTAEEMLRFMRALAYGEIFDDPATLELMQQRWNRFGFPRDQAALRAPGWPIEYGLGLMRFQLPRLLTPLHPMPAVIGHTGSTGSWLFYCPELDLFLAGTVDLLGAGAVPYRVVPRLLRVLDAADFPARHPDRNVRSLAPRTR